MTHSAEHPLNGAQQSVAEILLWQGKFRRGFAALIGFLSLSLKWTGLLDATSVLSVQVGTRTSLMVATAAVVVYLGYNEAMMAHLRRVGSASRTVLHAVLVGDLVLILMVLVSVTPPSEYARGLILTVFVVQFTRLYFGLRATVVSIMAAAVGYTGLIVASTLAGALAEPAEQFWNLAIFLLGSLMMLAVSWICRRSAPRRVDRWFRRLQLVSSALYSMGHGSNDAQKTMGIIWLLLIAAGMTTQDELPNWVIISCYVAIALGTLFGGWRIVKTMGQKITKLKPVGGFCAETGGAITLFLATGLGVPVSTTHTITGAIIGVGATRDFLRGELADVLEDRGTECDIELAVGVG